MRRRRHFLRCPLPVRTGQAIRAVTRRLTTLGLPVLVVVSLSACGGSLNSEFPSASLPVDGATGVMTTGSTPAAPAASEPRVPGIKAEATKSGVLKVAAEAKPGTGPANSPASSMSASKAAELMTAAGTPGSAAYKIGPLDVIELSVFKVPELSRAVQVADSGTANFPLVGEVQVVGRTAQDVERDLTKQLGSKYLQNPQLTVFVKEYNSQRVTVEGAVKKPGVFPIRGRNSLLQFLAMAEGMDPNAGSEILVFRQTDGKRAAAKFDLDDIRSGKIEDPVLQSGDVIVVPTSMMKESFNNLMKVVPALGLFRLL
jgi:polysaccharide biosynthesis/export protein